MGDRATRHILRTFRASSRSSPDAIASGEPFEWETRARRFDGVYRWVQSRGFPLRDANGHIVRWYNLLIDIDERKRAEEVSATVPSKNCKLSS